MTRERILYLATYDPHVPLTGTGMRGAEFVNRFGEHYDVDLLYIDGSGQPPIPELSEKYKDRVDRVKTKFVINFSRLGYFLFSWDLYRKAINLIHRYDHQFIVCDYGVSAIYGLLIQKFFKKKFIYLSHNIEHLGHIDKGKKDFRRYALALYTYYIEKLGVKNSSILVPITNDDARFYERWTDTAKMLIIPQGFDSEIFNPFYSPPEKDIKEILFCGNYGIQFNQEVVDVVMSQILDRVLAKNRNIKFIFIGANPPTDISHPNVEFTGFIKNYPEYLKRCDVFISPMLHGRGSPTKIIEALACGKNIVSTPIGSRSIENDYDSLHLSEISNFADKICSVLEMNRPVNSSDYDKIFSRYAWSKTIPALIQKAKYQCLSQTF
jgi:glycosyltransferase involved in cell wall biosynthesis